MSKLILPSGYSAQLEPVETQRAIKKIKDYFQDEIAYGLQLRRTTAPLFVDPDTGLNDNLNGVERRVDFTLKDMNEKKVEFSFRDMTKPMGVATYHSSSELPEAYKNILPSAEELSKLL